MGYTLVSGGSDNHLLLLDLRPQGIDGARVEKVLEVCHITVNKNAVPGDTKPFVPSGLRIGTPACTTRGLQESDFVEVAKFIARGIDLAVQLNKQDENATKLKQYLAAAEGAINTFPGFLELKKDVEKFSSQFPMPGLSY